MRQKTEQETMAAGRQINLLVEALDKAKTNGGVWLNPAGHPRPKMYPNGGTEPLRHEGSEGCTFRMVQLGHVRQ